MKSVLSISIVIKKIGIVLLDATAPHIVDPKDPGAIDEIINYYSQGNYCHHEGLISSYVLNNEKLDESKMETPAKKESVVSQPFSKSKLETLNNILKEETTWKKSINL